MPESIICLFLSKIRFSTGIAMLIINFLLQTIVHIHTYKHLKYKYIYINNAKLKKMLIINNAFHWN